ncbi:MAG: hypothetical protein V3R95_07445, partial [Dehalococcoidia bacterium]
ADAAVDQLRVPAGWEPLWLVASHAPDAAGEGVVVLYRPVAARWSEVARLRLDQWRGARQVDVTPDRGWIQACDADEVSRGFRLLAFDGGDLVVRFAVPPTASIDARPMRGIFDYDGDGLLDVVVDTSTRLLCEECFVEPSVDIYRWDGAALTAARLERLPAGAPSALRAQVDDAVELARAGLWLDAASEIEEVRLVVRADAGLDALAPTVIWDAVLIDFHVTEYRGASGHQGVPALVPLVGGDYDALIDAVRDTEPEQLFTTGGPLIVGTAAEGMTVELGRLFVERAAAAIAVRDDLAAAYFVRGLGRFLIDPNDVVTARADVRQAEGLRPYDEFFRAASQFLHAIDAAAPGQ